MRKLNFFVNSLILLTSYLFLIPKENFIFAAENEVTVETLADKINNMLPIAMGLGGIVAFILIIFGAFQIILSGGNPDRVKAGKEMITSAIAGLLLIIFSVFILRLIGHDILDIPGFG